jgi:hypothetical protein
MPLSGLLIVIGLFIGGCIFAAAFVASLVPVDGDQLPTPLRLLRRFSAINSGPVDIAVPVSRRSSGNVLRWRVASFGLAATTQLAVLRIVTDPRLESGAGAQPVAVGAAELLATALWCAYVVAAYRRVSGSRR